MKTNTSNPVPPVAVLRVAEPTADVLACALLQAIDDLAARAVLCRHDETPLGAASAAEYDADVDALRTVLETIAPGNRPPAPDRVAVRRFDGTWHIDDTRPVRLHRTDDLQALLESSLDLVDQQLLTAHEALTGIHDLLTTGNPTSRTHQRRADHRETPRHDKQPALRTAEPTTQQQRHRLAPRCETPSDRVAERGADRC